MIDNKPHWLSIFLFVSFNFFIASNMGTDGLLCAFVSTMFFRKNYKYEKILRYLNWTSSSSYNASSKNLKTTWVLSGFLKHNDSSILKKIKYQVYAVQRGQSWSVFKIQKNSFFQNTSTLLIYDSVLTASELAALHRWLNINLGIKS